MLSAKNVETGRNRNRSITGTLLLLFSNIKHITILTINNIYNIIF